MAPNGNHAHRDLPSASVFDLLMILLALTFEFRLMALGKLGAQVGFDDRRVADDVERAAVAEHRAVVKDDKPPHQRQHAISLGGRRVMLFPSKTTLPAVFGTKPVTRLTKVVLPAPLVPTRSTISPFGIDSVTLSTATTPPKRRVNPTMRNVDLTIGGGSPFAETKRAEGQFRPSLGVEFPQHALRHRIDYGESRTLNTSFGSMNPTIDA